MACAHKYAYNYDGGYLVCTKCSQHRSKDNNNCKHQFGRIGGDTICIKCGLHKGECEHNFVKVKGVKTCTICGAVIPDSEKPPPSKSKKKGVAVAIVAVMALSAFIVFNDDLLNLPGNSKAYEDVEVLEDVSDDTDDAAPIIRHIPSPNIMHAHSVPTDYSRGIHIFSYAIGTVDGLEFARAEKAVIAAEKAWEASESTVGFQRAGTGEINADGKSVNFVINFAKRSTQEGASHHPSGGDFTCKTVGADPYNKYAETCVIQVYAEKICDGKWVESSNDDLADSVKHGMGHFLLTGHMAHYPLDGHLMSGSDAGYMPYSFSARGLGMPALSGGAERVNCDA